MHDRLNEQKNEIQNLIQERAQLLEEIAKRTTPRIQTTDNESQTDDRQHEKLTQLNNKLKRALQTVKDKINRIANERPELFNGVGEETSERLDYLITTLENQAAQLDELQAKHAQHEEQLQREIKELQRYDNIHFISFNTLSLVICIVLWKHINIKLKMKNHLKWNNLFQLLRHLHLLKISG